MKVSLRALQSLNDTYKTGVDPWSYGADEVVKRIGLQLGARADVKVDSLRKTVEIHYAPVTGLGG